jgi:hypothetical protein
VLWAGWEPAAAQEQQRKGPPYPMCPSTCSERGKEMRIIIFNINVNLISETDVKRTTWNETGRWHGEVIERKGESFRVQDFTPVH